MDDEIIERVMSKMMMNVELTMKIVEFGMIEIGEFTMHEEADIVMESK